MQATVNGINIAYEDDGKGTPVILIHAFPFNRRMWTQQIEKLRGICRVIAPDLRGFGESEVCGEITTMEILADDIHALMQHLKIEKAVLVGLSMGGYVAMTFSWKYADALMGLVLADTRHNPDNEEGRARRLKSATKAEQEGVLAILDDMIPSLLTLKTISENPILVKKVKSLALLNNPHGVAAAQRGMSERLDSTNTLLKIGCPAMIIVGCDDVLSPIDVADSMHSLIPDSSLVVIHNAGHLSNMEQPDLFNNALVDFIQTRLL